MFGDFNLCEYGLFERLWNWNLDALIKRAVARSARRVGVLETAGPSDKSYNKAGQFWEDIENNDLDEIEEQYMNERGMSKDLWTCERCSDLPDKDAFKGEYYMLNESCILYVISSTFPRWAVFGKICCILYAELNFAIGQDFSEVLILPKTANIILNRLKEHN